MKSFQLKLILILLFLAVNIFFVIKISELNKSKNTFDQAEISEAVRVLYNKNVKISNDTVIKEKNVPNIIKLDFDSDSFEKIAKKIMKGEYGSFTIPDGFSYTNDSESLSLSYDYEIEYSYTPENISYNDVKKVLEKVSSVDEEGEKGAKTLSKLFFSEIKTDPYVVTIKPIKSITKGNVTYIEAIQCVDSHEVPEATIIAVINEKNVSYVSGRLFFSESFVSYESDTFDSINILFEIEPSHDEITDMALIFTSVFDENNSVYLTPSYRFTYSDNSVKIYDATSASRRTQ